MPKPKKLRVPSQLEIWKGIRKNPTPPGKTIQPKDRAIEDDSDEREMEQWRGWRGESYEEFEDD